MNRILIGGLVLAGLLLAGCGGGTEADVHETSTSETPSNSFPTEEEQPPAVVEEAPTESEPEIAKVGATEWFTYEDGTEVQVTSASRTTVSEFSGSGPGLQVTITVNNGSNVVLDLSLANTVLYTGPNGSQQEVDYGADEIGFTGSLPPTKSGTASWTFPLPAEHKEFLVEFAPTWDHEATFFEGSLP